MQFKSVPEHDALDISNNGTGTPSPKAINSKNTVNEGKGGGNGARISPVISATMDWKSINIRELLPFCSEANHPDAWIELHRRLDPRIKNQVKRLVLLRTKATRELVDDLTHDTWYKIIYSGVLKKTYPVDGAFYRYVITTVVSVVNDHFRRPEWKIIGNAVTVDDPDNPINLFASDAKDNVCRNEIENILRHKFGSKPHFARDLAIFRLYYWQGYSAPQIAQLCSLPVADVANILIRMQNALKRELRGDNQKDTT